jgi:hypothetical protein
MKIKYIFINNIDHNGELPFINSQKITLLIKVKLVKKKLKVIRAIKTYWL